jgi:hypothetical protein
MQHQQLSSGGGGTRAISTPNSSPMMIGGGSSLLMLGRCIRATSDKQCTDALALISQFFDLTLILSNLDS